MYILKINNTATARSKSYESLLEYVNDNAFAFAGSTCTIEDNVDVIDRFQIAPLSLNSINA